MRAASDASVLLNLLHRAVSIGWVYDCSQAVVGARLVRRRVASFLQDCRAGDRILDLGGGTGALQPFLPRHCGYVCVDLEMPKLRRYVRKATEPMAILADATALPFPPAAFDAVVCMAVAHHLDDASLEKAVAEGSRVLKPGGRFLLLDPVLSGRWPPGRLLWSLDRGARPRTPEALHQALERTFQIVYWGRFRIFHEYVLDIGIPSCKPAGQA